MHSRNYFSGYYLKLPYFLNKTCATFFQVMFVGRLIKSGIVVNWSTITSIWKCPWDSGSWIMKSVEMEAHAA